MVILKRKEANFEQIEKGLRAYFSSSFHCVYAGQKVFVQLIKIVEMKIWRVMAFYVSIFYYKEGGIIHLMNR